MYTRSLELLLLLELRDYRGATQHNTRPIPDEANDDGDVLIIRYLYSACSQAPVLAGTGYAAGRAACVRALEYEVVVCT